MNALDLTKYADQCRRNLAVRGLETSMTRNNNDALERMERIRDYPISNPLSAIKHDFTETNSFWLFFTHNGFDVGGVAAKYSDIGSERTSDYWARTLTRLFFPDGDGKVRSEDVSDVLPIRGRIVYLGDLFLDASMRGSRDQLREVMHLLFCMSLAKWPDLDWVYSFLRDQDCGKAQFYGFTDIIPTPLTWSHRKTGRSDQEHVAAIPKNRLHYALPRWQKSAETCDLVQDRNKSKID